jgi:tetratricopeptide (TPR) repeat protein
MASARRGELEAAARVARQLHSLSQDPDLLMRLANLLGGIAFEAGRLDEAERWLEEVIRRAGPGIDPKMAARASNNLASIAHLRGKRGLALSLYRSALLIWREAGDLLGEAQTAHNLGIVAREEGAIAEATEYAECAVAAAGRTGDGALQGLALMGRAEIALIRGDGTAARADLAAAHTLARQAGDAVGLADADRLAARIALAEGRPREALRMARAGYARANRLGAVQLAGECAELCARASRWLLPEERVTRYRAEATRRYAALGARAALRRLAGEAER